MFKARINLTDTRTSVAILEVLFLTNETLLYLCYFRTLSVLLIALLFLNLASYDYDSCKYNLSSIFNERIYLLYLSYVHKS